MTVQEALQRICGRKPGVFSRRSVSYVESLVSKDETVAAAVAANIVTRRGHFPGIVVLTDRRVMAVCDLPGIKRFVTLDLDRLETCNETTSFLNYKAAFYTQNDGFSMTINPEIGERFSRCLAVLNGEEEEFDSADGAGGGILNPILARNMFRKRRAREKEKACRKEVLEAASSQFAADLEAERAAAAENRQDVSQHFSQHTERTDGQEAVTSIDPRTVAARLAAELAGKGECETQ